MYRRQVLPAVPHLVETVQVLTKHFLYCNIALLLPSLSIGSVRKAGLLIVKQGSNHILPVTKVFSNRVHGCMHMFDLKKRGWYMSLQVEGTFRDGTKLVTVHNPFTRENGDLALALHGSFLPGVHLWADLGFLWANRYSWVCSFWWWKCHCHLFLIPSILWFFCYSVYAVPPLSAFPVLLEEALPGQMFVAPGKIICSAGRRAVILSVSNQADRPIQVSILFSEIWATSGLHGPNFCISSPNLSLCRNH